MIDEHIIREKAAELERMMERLEHFRGTQFTREICKEGECNWGVLARQGHYGNPEMETNVLHSYEQCRECGVERIQVFKLDVDASQDIEDPWADMRPDGGEEE
mgnify:CR=1 FL=1|tara:strand:+ start:308 stop:616 length:309 start_codon:yes stop_codon:yes gene_type:complete